MTKNESLKIWKESGLGETYWTFEFAAAIERTTVNKVIEILTVYGLGKDHVVKEIKSIAAPTPSTPAPKNCQTGWADFCKASQHDGVACPADSCDIDDGVRKDHASSTPAPVATNTGGQCNGKCCGACNYEQCAAPPTRLDVGEARDAAVPFGWKLTPHEPTKEMLDAGREQWHRIGSISDAWQSMWYAASPPTPKEQDLAN